MTDACFGAALTRLWPRCGKPLAEGIITTAPAVFEKYAFSPLVVAHFMAQISHECGCGTEIVENLNYSPEGIVRTWPLRFKSLSAAMPFAHAPQKLANQVYNGRMGNRVGSNDGWIFRGHGPTNTTGHDGFFRLAQKMAQDLVNNPDLVNRPDLFLECGVVDFILCGCVPFAQRDDIRGVTHHLNGGLIGLAQREAWLPRWKSALLPIHGADALSAPHAARPEGQLQYGDKGFEVKGLQAELKAKGYGVGAEDGEFHESTRGAVAKLQLDHGLPATGVADQATRDALARSQGAPIGEGRATATVKDLRQSGSRTVAGADRIGLIGWIKAALGLSTAAAAGGSELAGSGLDLDKVQAGIDKAQQAAGILSQLKGLAAPLLGHPLVLPIAIAIAIAGIVLVFEGRRIKAARLEDHRNAANMGR